MNGPITLTAAQRAQVEAAIATIEQVLNPATPTTSGRVVPVPAGADLQAAITAAQAGDVLTLSRGATFIGNFVLPAKTGAVTITTDAPPAPGQRVTPSSGFARLLTPNSAPVLATKGPAMGWAIVGLELAGDGAGDLVTLGDGSPAQNSLSLVPGHLSIDRCYLHGSPARGGKRGIALNSGATVVRECYLANFKLSGQDAQALGGWNGPGPFTITNNYLEAAGNNVLFGGADPAIPNLVPSDIVFSGNLVSKPLAWRGLAWQVKNLFELKNAQRVTVAANVFENCWSDAQAGTAIVLTVRNQDGAAPWSIVRDVAFDRNHVDHAAAVLQILGSDDTPGKPSGRMAHVTITNLLARDIDPKTWGNPLTGAWGASALVTILGGQAGGPQGLDLGHLTLVGAHHGRFLALGGTGLTDLLDIHDSIFTEGDYGITGDNTGLGRAALTVYAPTAIFTHNAIVQTPSSDGSSRMIDYGPQPNLVLPIGTPPEGATGPTTDGLPLGATVV